LRSSAAYKLRGKAIDSSCAPWAEENQGLHVHSLAMLGSPARQHKAGFTQTWYLMKQALANVFELS
jgi:hypothetical protein